MGITAVSDAPLHVLAVDDSNLDRKLIERLLKSFSYNVTAIDSGSKALEFLGLHDLEKLPSLSPNPMQEVEVNLIITDYCMPGMTGFELLRKIKESTSLKDIPVVIMSSENVPARIKRCLEEGAEEFFLKPVRLSDVDKLKPYLSKRTTMENITNVEMGKELKPERELNPHRVLVKSENITNVGMEKETRCHCCTNGEKSSLVV